MYFDIQSSNITIKKLFNFFDIKINKNPTQEDYQKLEEKLYDIVKRKYDENIYDINNGQKFKKSTVQITNICLGDFIEIKYTPPSVKYINDYPQLSGIVIYIDPDNNDGLIYSNNCGFEIIYSFSRSHHGCGSNFSHIFLYHFIKYEKKIEI
jgi:hypothetical protein